MVEGQDRQRLNTQSAVVLALHLSPEHSFSKRQQTEIELLAGHGVKGDAHCGVTVKHRSRVAVDPNQPNLRQVHLVHQELLEELRAAGFRVEPGTIGENVTTSGLDILSLPRGTRLRLGETATIELTGLRNPCVQLDHVQQGLTQAVLGRDADGQLIRKAGVMAIVLSDGTVRPGDPISVELPPLPHYRLEKV